MTEEETGKIIVYGNYIHRIDSYTEIHHVDHYHNYVKEEADDGGATASEDDMQRLPAVVDADAAVVGPHEEEGEALRQIAAALAPSDPQGTTAKVFEQVFLEPQALPQRQQLQEYALKSLKTNRGTNYRMGAVALSPVVRIIGHLHRLGVYAAGTDRAALVRLIPSGSYDPPTFYKALNAYARRGASDNTPRKQPELDLLAWISEMVSE